MFAAFNKQEAVVVELVRAGANLNEKNKVRQLLTYFHHFVAVFDFNIVVILL